MGLVLGRPGVTRKPYASHKSHKIQIAHAPTNLALVDRSVIPFNSKPQKTQQLQLNPKPQNPTTTPQGEERPHTPHHRKGGAPPISRPLTFGGGRGGGAAERVTIYIYIYIYLCVCVFW